MTKSRNIHKPHIIKKCLNCQKEFELLYCRRERKFCCHNCSAEYSKGKSHYWKPKTIFKKGHKPSPETRAKMSKNRKGKGGLKGKDNPRWKGIKYKRYIHTTWTKKYKEWRKAVFERDNYTCQKCGKIGGYIQAHHIKSWAKYKDKRYLIENGVCLCVKCHKNIHSSKKIKNNLCQKKH